MQSCDELIRGVYSSKKSELFPRAKRHLSDPSPISQLQVPPNQGHRSNFLPFFFFLMMGGGCYSAKWLLGCTGGCLKGNVPPSEAGTFCIFETGIMQLDEYFWPQI